jgi:hypothetical protein
MKIQLLKKNKTSKNKLPMIGILASIVKRCLSRLSINSYNIYLLDTFMLGSQDGHRHTSFGFACHVFM